MTPSQSLCLAAALFPAVVRGVSPMENIIVTGNRSHALRGRIPASVTVISREDIARSGADTIAQALRSSGILALSDLFGNGVEASVGLRGFTATAQHNTLVMVDGRRLNNVDNGQPDLNTISLQQVERIEIVNGSQGALFGDKAVGGTINIVTREPRETLLRGEVQYGSYNRRSLHLDAEHRTAGGVRLQAAGTRDLSDNYRDRNASRLTDIKLLAGWEHHSGDVAVEFQQVNEDLELPGALFGDLLAEDRRQALNPGDFTATGTRVLRVSLEQQAAPWLTAYAEYTNRLSDERGRLSSGGAAGDFTLDRHHIEFTPRLAARLPLPAGEAVITLGADLFDTDYRIASEFGLTDDHQSQRSVYLHAIVPLADGLDLGLGGRHSRVGNDILVDTLAFGRSLPEGTAIDDTANAVEAGLSWRPGTNWRLFGRVARNFRFVSADEYSAVADNNFFAELFAAGTPVPLPETQTGLSYEAGAEWSGPDGSLRGLIYRLDLDNEIGFDPRLFLNTNIGDSRRLGLVLEGRYALSEAVLLQASYSYTDARLTGGRFNGSDLTSIPAHTGSLTGSYRFGRGLTAYLEVVATGDRRFGGDFENVFPDLPGHVVGNINLRYRRGPWRLAMRVNNLLDRHYSDAGNIGFDFRRPFPAPQVRTFYPAPGRNVLLSLQYTYR